jgi:hypothetical protein
MQRRLFAAFVVFWLSACAHAQGHGELVLPNLDKFKRHATQTVDIDVGPLRLAIASWFLGDGDPDTAVARNILKACKAVHVRSYQFGPDFEYPEADIDALRSQLSGGGWSQLAKVRDRAANEDVDVFIAFQNEKITGFTVIASKPRELTIVNVAGAFDPQQLDELREQFGSPHRWRRAASDDAPPGL